jgi:hypothetical protein
MFEKMVQDWTEDTDSDVGPERRRAIEHESMKWDLNICERLNWLRRRRNRSTFRKLCLVRKNKKTGKVYNSVILTETHCQNHLEVAIKEVNVLGVL